MRNAIPASALLPLLIAFTMSSTTILATDPAKYDATWRYGEIMIPKISATPTIDGTINDDEWSRATLFPATLVMDPSKGAGMPTTQRTRIWMAYTNDSLYVAFRQELPADHLPLEVSITDKRDACEGIDNTINFFFAPKPEQYDIQYNMAFNAASQIFDRRLDHPSNIHWDGKMTYKSRLIDTGWEGELQIPFTDFELTSAPADGTKWKCNLYSFWRKPVTLLSSWPLTRWRAKGEVGWMIFGGENTPAVHFDDAAMVEIAGGEAQVKTELYRRKERAKQSFMQQVASAIQVSQVEGGTFESFDKIIGDGLAPFEPATAIDTPAEYVLRYDVKAGDKVLAAGVQPYYKAAPLEISITPMFLESQVLVVEALTELANARTFEVTLEGKNLTGNFRSQRAEIAFPTKDLAEGSYEISAEAKDESGKVLASAKSSVVRPPPPDWWTMKEGFEPLVPPPWTPIKATKEKAEILGRVYEFKDQPLPAQIETQGQQILAAPIEIKTAQPWKSTKVELKESADDFATYVSESVGDNGVTLKTTTRVEFDGFMLVDLDLVGAQDGATIDKLDLVIPFKKEHAVLLQNYCMAPGPGDNTKAGGNVPHPTNPYKKGKRFVGEIPADGLQTPPTLTAWIGTDHYGLEWSIESSKGWSMAKPNSAIEITRDGDKVIFTVHFISRPVKLSKDTPRHIQFGLVATPTKTLMPYLMKARFYDDYFPALLPGKWGEYPVWHPPLKNTEVAAKTKAWLDKSESTGTKILINGGWNISAQSPEFDTWLQEMCADPLENASFSDAKQFAACWKSPFGEFMANSFGYNARLLKFWGIRFDTVVPGYECKSLHHKDCGWRDDDGALWGQMPIFAQREVWKRLYRIFHGGVINEGCIQTPNAAGPIMAIHSFADHHEIGEGYYMHAKTLKDAYPPDMVRANMTGLQYGFRAENNIKSGPLYWNMRNAVLLVAGAEPRFTDYRVWRAGYEAHGNPAISCWNAWDWVDRWNAKFLGWWENKDYITTAAGENMLLASFYHHPVNRRVLLTVTNYEEEPLDELPVKLDLGKLGMQGEKLYAEDAITLEPLEIGADGSLKLDVLAQRYRLIKISADVPQYDASKLGDNVLKDAPAEISQSWQSPDLKLDPNSTYVIAADLKIDKDLGADSKNPNAMLMFGPTIGHYAAIQLSGEGINGVNAINKIALCAPKDGTQEYQQYKDTDFFRRASVPQPWEKTPGWTTVFVPFGTGEKTQSGKVVISMTDPGQAVMKNVTVRKVK